MSDTCQCVTLVKRTPIPGPTTGRMHVCQNCGKEWRVEPWGKVSVQMGTQPLAAPAMTKLAELLVKHEYLNGYCLCREFRLPPYGKKELDEWAAVRGDWMQDIRWHYWLEHVREALQKLPGT